MDSWTSVRQQSDFRVYLGLWTNWSQGRILGSTLTLTKSNGALVIAFAAFFVTIIATRFWRMSCIVAHHVYCRHFPEPRDALYHQRQVILRNSPTAISGLRTFFLVILAHRKSARHLFIRVFPILLFSLLSIGAFTALTYFLPQITAAMSDQVLLLGNNCGIISESAAELDDFEKSLTILNPYLSSQISDAENYAQQCYSGSSQALQCSAFVADRIPSTIDNIAECPFQGGICRLNASNIKLDTGLIDFNKYFGINIPPDESISVRQSLHCAPLVTDGYTSSHRVADRNYTRYHYGSYFDAARPKQPYLNATVQFIDVDGQYPHTEDYDRYSLPSDIYELMTLYTLVVNGTATATSYFQPIPELRRDDADLMLSFLSGSGVYFAERSPDPWYRATTIAGNTTIDALNSSVHVYRMDEAVSPLGCAIQWQFCQGAALGTPVCGDLASFNDALSSFQLNDTINLNSKLSWYLEILYYSPGIFDLLQTLEAQSLASMRTLSNGVQSPIPQNQWQLDVAHWWATFLAAEQAYFVDVVTGPPDSFQIPAKWIQGPADDQERDACDSQKVRSAIHSSFNMFGLALFFVGGTLIVLVSLALEPILALLQKRWGYQQYAYLEWVSHETLQLQRLAHEELGFGTWSGATNAIPTTELDDKLTCLDLRDAKHPRLQVPLLEPEKHSDSATSGESNRGDTSFYSQKINHGSFSNHSGGEEGER